MKSPKLPDKVPEWLIRFMRNLAEGIGLMYGLGLEPRKQDHEE